MTDKQMAGVAEMDALFRRADFAAESSGLEARLWVKIKARLATERELSEDELSKFAAAGGAPQAQAAGRLGAYGEKTKGGVRDL